jgi:hypothetical protein
MLGYILFHSIFDGVMTTPPTGLATHQNIHILKVASDSF